MKIGEVLGAAGVRFIGHSSRCYDDRVPSRKKKTRAAGATRAAGGGPRPPLLVPQAWSQVVQSGALAAGDRASGLGFGPPGLGRTELDDRLLALGFPKMLLLADIELDLTALAAKDALHRHYYPWTFGVWSRSLVLRLVRSFEHLIDPDTRAAALTGSEPAPIDDAEVDELVASAAFLHGGRWVVYALEALTSTERVAAAIRRFFAETEAGEWLDGPLETNGVGVAGAIPFIARRLPPAECDALLAASRSALDAARSTAGTGFAGQAVRQLEVALDGLPAIDRIWPAGNPNRLTGLAYATGGREQVAREAAAVWTSMKPADRQPFDLQLAVLGGEETVRILAQSVGRFHADWLRPAVATLGRLRADIARPAMETLATMKGHADEASAWLAANPDIRA
jgi:hypothetical protein